VAGGVVQFAGDAGAFLGGGEASFAFRLAFGPLRAILQFGDALLAQPRAVAGHPDPEEDHRPRDQWHGDLAQFGAARRVSHGSGWDEDIGDHQRDTPPR
jgi:hypothetical protein